MDYNTAVNWILSFSDYERSPGHAYSLRFDLRRMEELLRRCGNPHLGARTIHIAGSKGKGSTAALIAAGLTAAGERSGLYTSPHLHTIRERIRVDGEPISEEHLVALVDRLRPQAEAVNLQSTYEELTTFEILTALAFIYFQQRRAAFQVVETGLGGRLDATNVVRPEVCVLTSISLDHTSVLGDTVAKIAGEKAGIIKEGAVAVCAPQQAEVQAVIREVCRQQGVPLISVGNDVAWRRTATDLSTQSVEVRALKGNYRVAIPLLGSHQLENAATAVAALEAVGVSKEDIERGLARTRWPGRLQILGQDPLLVVDGAHNGDSARRLREALQECFQFQRCILIIATSADKDIAAIATELLPLGSSVIVTRTRHPRAADPYLLASAFHTVGAAPLVAEDVPRALAQAQAMAGERDLICATGSLFLVAEVIQYVEGWEYHEPYPVAGAKEVSR